MKQIEKLFFYEYFLNRINELENEYIQVNNNMRVKDYANCDALDFLELMLLKTKLEYTIKIYKELRMLLNLK